MAEARAVKFCTKGDYIKSCQRDDKSPLKGAWFCATVDVEKIIQNTPITEIKNVVDHGLQLITPTALKATLRLRPKLHRFDLSLYFWQTWYL